MQRSAVRAGDTIPCGFVLGPKSSQSLRIERIPMRR